MVLQFESAVNNQRYQLTKGIDTPMRERRFPGVSDEAWNNPVVMRDDPTAIYLRGDRNNHFPPFMFDPQRVGQPEGFLMYDLLVDVSQFNIALKF